jgi:hypothetical protein
MPWTAQPAWTLKDRRAADNGHSTRCGEATWRNHPRDTQLGRELFARTLRWNFCRWCEFYDYRTARNSLRRLALRHLHHAGELF